MQVIELLEAGISSLDLLFVLTALGLGSMLTYVTAGSLAERYPPGTWATSSKISALLWEQSDCPWRFNGPDVEIRGRLHVAGRRDGQEE